MSKFKRLDQNNPSIRIDISTFFITEKSIYLSLLTHFETQPIEFEITHLKQKKRIRNIHIE